MRAGPLALGLLAVLVACGDDGAGFVRDGGPTDGGVAVDAVPTDVTVEGDAGDGGEPGDAGPSDAGASDAGSAEDAVAFTFDRQEALCDLMIRCASKLGNAYALNAQRQCHPLAREEQFEFSLDRLEAGAVSFDPAMAAACLEELEAVTCEQVIQAFEFTPSCLSVFVGASAPGGPCSVDLDCRPSGFCERDGSCPGTCVAVRGEGGPCTRAEHCSTGMCVGGTCVAAAGEGSECVLHAQCTGELYCSSSYECTALAAAGEACDNTYGESWCSEDLVCPLGGGTCGTGEAEGGSCAGGVPCVVGTQCDWTDTDTCVVVGGPGDACTADNQCPAYFYCRGGACTPWPGEGESCVGAPACARGSCESGVCRTEGIGGDCTVADYAKPFGHCSTSTYCDSTTRTCRPRFTEGSACTRRSQCGAGLTCFDGECVRYCDAA